MTLTLVEQSERSKLIFDYLDTPKQERIPLSQFLSENHMTRRIYYRLKAVQDHAIQQAGEGKQSWLKKRKAVELLEDESTRLARQIREMDEAVFDAATINKIAKMAELWYKRRGLLIDKVEQKVEIKLSADELTKRNLEAERELKQWRLEQGRMDGQRVEEVPEESSLLHD